MKGCTLRAVSASLQTILLSALSSRQQLDVLQMLWPLHLQTCDLVIADVIVSAACAVELWTNQLADGGGSVPSRCAWPGSCPRLPHQLRQQLPGQLLCSPSLQPPAHSALDHS